MTELSMDKNKDYVIAEHQALLRASQCSFFSGLFPPLTEESSKQSKLLSSIGSRFKQQLQALLKTLRATKPHYVRCIKPNNVLKPAIFERKNVLQQLHCGGVMEAIKISCAGYPIRKPFFEFVDQFGILAPEVLDPSSDEVTICKRLLEKVGLMAYEICRTVVFLRADQMVQLEARRNEILGISASIIQRNLRYYWARQSFVSLQKYTMLIQALCRVQLARLTYVHMRREVAYLRIQKDLRMHIARKAYLDLYNSAICIRTGLRGMAALCELQLRKQIKAAIIQSHCRKYLVRVQYLNTKKAAITIQCAWRGRVARKELRKLKMAAISKLEKQVEELTGNLELEKRKRADFEASMNQEYANLQSALNDIQLQFKQTKESLSSEIEKLKERQSKTPANENDTCQNLWKRVRKCICV